MALKIMETLKNYYTGKKILVVGLGLQGGGVGVARFFAELNAIVTVTDKKKEEQLAPSIAALKDLPITFHLGGHVIEDFISADVIFKGPGVMWRSPEIVAAQERNIPVEMEMSFVAANLPCTIIGITGTRGKSTTTNLIYSVLKSMGFSVHLGGGLPGISNIEFLKTLTDKDYLVAELSSWALSGFHRKKISPHIAVFTNIFPDHLNYYREMGEYLHDKKAIFDYQKDDDFLIINKSFVDISNNAKSNVVTFQSSDFTRKLKVLKGVHNLENAAAALKVAEVLKLDLDQAAGIISEFGGLPFRQEVVGRIKNVTFINDTTSTTPIAAIKAINSFSDGKIYMILGGNSKNLPHDELINELDRVNKIILLQGSFTEEIIGELEKKYKEKITESYDNLEAAVGKAYDLASADGKPAYVLFSPAATSFAMFNNEFHRGREFNLQVSSLMQNAK